MAGAAHTKHVSRISREKSKSSKPEENAPFMEGRQSRADRMFRFNTRNTYAIELKVRHQPARVTSQRPHGDPRDKHTAEDWSSQAKTSIEVEIAKSRGQISQLTLA